jgi:hypothetical protein
MGYVIATGALVAFLLVLAFLSTLVPALVRAVLP